MPYQYANDLEERLFLFAFRVRELIQLLPNTQANSTDGVQLLRASGSVGANYIEAREGVSTKDYFYRAKVCKKEVRECTYWLRLLNLGEDLRLRCMHEQLVDESIELSKISGQYVEKKKRSKH
jgi:four helix bundle protein